METPFLDRSDAGRMLGQALALRNDPDPVILALPRGGVPVAAEVARALNAPLDLVLVRKIATPSRPELAVGAVVNGASPEIVVNKDIAAFFGITPDDIRKLADAELDVIRRRRALYLAGRSPMPLKGRSAIVVDDGLATGATMRAALRAVRRQGPARLIMAVPVAAAEGLAGLQAEADFGRLPANPEEFRRGGCALCRIQAGVG